MKNNKLFAAIIAGGIAIIAILAIVLFKFFLPSGAETPEANLRNPVTSQSVKKTPKKTEAPKEEPILDRFKDLQAQNPDVVGWIKLPNSRVDYPVMYTPHDMEFYLRRDINKNADIYGVPFIDTRCDLNSDNLLIYGHETDNGTQFHDFLNYQSKDFWEQNKTFEYSDLKHNYRYEVVAFGRSRVYNVDDQVFKYYKFFGSSNEQEFNDYLAGIKGIQLYDTGVQAQYGDHLLTLSMCVTPYGDPDDGRFVLVARRAEKID